MRDYYHRHAFDHHFWAPLIIGAAIWPLGGYLYIGSDWERAEKQFLDYHTSQPPTPPNQSLQRTAG